MKNDWVLLEMQTHGLQKHHILLLLINTCFISVAIFFQVPPKANLAEVAIVPGGFTANGAIADDIQRLCFVELTHVRVPFSLLFCTFI